MGTMNNGTSWNDAVTINKQSGTKITLDTDNKFVAKDIELTINVQAGSAATPDTAITANPTLSINNSTGVVTGTVSTTKSVTPTVSAGYISTGSAGTMTVSGSNTLSLSTQNAQTIIPTTTDQTIESGKYLIGVQTIKGDADLIPANIKNGVSIFNVTGTGMTDVTLTQDYNGVIDIPKTTTDVNTIVLQSKNVTPSASSQSIEPDTGYFGLSKVDIDGDENLVPENIAEGISIFGVTGTHSGGGADPTDFIENHDTWTSYENLSASKIGAGTFCNCNNLTTVSFPACTTIGASAFTNCFSLTSVNFPECTSIGSYAFRLCSNLASVSFPACTIIGTNAFGNCSRLTLINFPACTSTSSHAFDGCSNLSTISLPVCKNIGSYAFLSCSRLTTASFPACTMISEYTFNSCYNLISLYLTGSSFVTLRDSYVFLNSPIGGYSAYAGQYGSIYVPSSMLADYKIRTNWTYFSSRFVGV